MPDIKSTTDYVIKQGDKYYSGSIPDSEGDFIHLFKTKLIEAKKYISVQHAERYINMLNKAEYYDIKVVKVKTVVSINEVEPEVTYTGYVFGQPVQKITINVNDFALDEFTESKVVELSKKLSEHIAKQLRSRGSGYAPY